MHSNEILPQQKNALPSNFFTWFTIAWTVHLGRLFRFVFPSPDGSPWSSCGGFCPLHCPLSLFLEGRSAAPIAAVEPQVTAQRGKVKQFQFQVTLIPWAANRGSRCKQLSPPAAGPRVQEGRAGSGERNHHSCHRASLLLRNLSPKSLPTAKLL